MKHKLNSFLIIGIMLISLFLMGCSLFFEKDPEKLEEMKKNLKERQEQLDVAKEKLDEYNKQTVLIDRCIKACGGEDIKIPLVRDEWWQVCYDIYYYSGEEGINNFIADCQS